MKMPQYCCVPGCKNAGGHRFPTDPYLNRKWRVAIKRMDEKKRLWKPGRFDVVCHEHFLPNDYRLTLLGDRSRLKADAVPSVFDFRKSDDPSESTRTQRLKSRSDQNIPHMETDDVQQEVEVVTTQLEPSDDKRDGEIDQHAVDQHVQCDLQRFCKFSVECFRDDPKLIKFYTGFENYDHFMMFFQCLGPCAYELEYKCTLINPVDKLFMAMMKLRQAKEDLELSMLFKVSQSTVSRIIITWINFLYFQLKELDIWPSREVIDQHMPSDFARKFPSTRVILDATEVSIPKPSNVNAQCASWSSYKHKNTLKTMIGCSPKGTVTYISDAYGGSTADRQIIESSELLDPSLHMFEKGDSIMADRGIMVQDLFASQDVHVNTPTFLKGKLHLDAHEVVHDRRVASKRIHVERVIGLSKSFKILKYGIPSGKVPLGSRIIYICFALSNFRTNIVHSEA